MENKFNSPKGIMVLERHYFTKTTTIGRLYLNGQYFCYTLEDAVRAEGIKVDDHTAIAEGVYMVKNTWSPTFKRPLPLIYDAPDGTVSNKHIPYEGLRFHGGNSHINTKGCPCVSANWDGHELTWDTMEKPLVEWCERFPEALLIVSNRKIISPLFNGQ